MSGSARGEEIDRLIHLLAKLPGLGPRSARRAALALLKKRETLLEPLAAALAEARQRMVWRAIAFAHALRHRLRRSDAAPDVEPWIAPREWERVRALPNLPHALRLEMGADLAVENERVEGGEPVGDLVASHSALRGVEVPPGRPER